MCGLPYNIGFKFIGLDLQQAELDHALFFSTGFPAFYAPLQDCQSIFSPRLVALDVMAWLGARVMH